MLIKEYIMDSLFKKCRKTTGWIEKIKDLRKWIKARL